MTVIDRTFDQVFEELRAERAAVSADTRAERAELRAEMRALRLEIREDTRALSDRLGRLEERLGRIGFRMSGILATGFVALVATQL